VRDPSPDEEANPSAERQPVTAGCPLLPAILQAVKELFLLPFFSLFLVLGAEASPKCSSYAVDLADADAQIKTLLECCLNA